MRAVKFKGAFALLVGIYMLRVYLLNGWYIITYGLGIYLLNNFIGFLSPQVLSGNTFTQPYPCSYACIDELICLRNSLLSNVGWFCDPVVNLLQIDPENEGPVLPTRDSEEFRYFPVAPGA